MIIGIGTHSGGDDQAGLLVSGRLRELSVEAIDYSGELLGLMDLWEGADRVILVDAMRSGEAPGSVRRLDWGAAPFAGQELPISTHGLGPFAILSLAAELGRYLLATNDPRITDGDEFDRYPYYGSKDLTRWLE